MAAMEKLDFDCDAEKRFIILLKDIECRKLFQDLVKLILVPEKKRSDEKYMCGILETGQGVTFFLLHPVHMAACTIKSTDTPEESPNLSMQKNYFVNICKNKSLNGANEKISLLSECVIGMPFSMYLCQSQRKLNSHFVTYDMLLSFHPNLNRPGFNQMAEEMALHISDSESLAQLHMGIHKRNLVISTLESKELSLPSVVRKRIKVKVQPVVSPDDQTEITSIHLLVGKERVESCLVSNFKFLSYNKFQDHSRSHKTSTIARLENVLEISPAGKVKSMKIEDCFAKPISPSLRSKDDSHIPNKEKFKIRTYSETGEYIVSNCNQRGILKNSFLPRNLSESSDDSFWSSSTDLVSTFGSETKVAKKSVRFNDHVNKSIFRPNSSILGQKKKNQKRNQNKKKKERRSSESEASDSGTLSDYHKSGSTSSDAKSESDDGFEFIEKDFDGYIQSSPIQGEIQVNCSNQERVFLENINETEKTQDKYFKSTWKESKQLEDMKYFDLAQKQGTKNTHKKNYCKMNSQSEYTRKNVFIPTFQVEEPMPLNFHATQYNVFGMPEHVSKNTRKLKRGNKKKKVKDMFMDLDDTNLP